MWLYIFDVFEKKVNEDVELEDDESENEKQYLKDLKSWVQDHGNMVLDFLFLERSQNGKT